MKSKTRRSLEVSFEIETEAERLYLKKLCTQLVARLTDDGLPADAGRFVSQLQNLEVWAYLLEQENPRIMLLFCHREAFFLKLMAQNSDEPEDEKLSKALLSALPPMSELEALTNPLPANSDVKLEIPGCDTLRAVRPLWPSEETALTEIRAKHRKGIATGYCTVKTARLALSHPCSGGSFHVPAGSTLRILSLHVEDQMCLTNDLDEASMTPARVMLHVRSILVSNIRLTR